MSNKSSSTKIMASNMLLILTKVLTSTKATKKNTAFSLQNHASVEYLEKKNLYTALKSQNIIK